MDAAKLLGSFLAGEALMAGHLLLSNEPREHLAGCLGMGVRAGLSMLAALGNQHSGWFSVNNWSDAIFSFGFLAGYMYSAAALLPFLGLTWGEAFTGGLALGPVDGSKEL